MENNESMVYCSRCGAEMNINSRYCMKCGNLNENHPDNNKYSKILKDNNNDNYQIGSGKRIFNSNKNKSGVNFITEKNTNRMHFIIFNIVAIAIMCIISLIPLFSIKSFSIKGLLDTGVFTTIFINSIIIMMFVSIQIVYIKINEYWWVALIPFYNLYRLSDVLFGKGWLFVLSFIPGVNGIYLLVVYYVLGKSFGKNGILSALFFPIMIPIIAFGSSPYNGVYYVVGDSPNALEETYESYGRFAKFSIGMFVIGLIGSFISNKDFLSINKNKDALSMIGGAKIAINNVKKAIKKDNVSCYDVNSNKISIANSGVYYFYSDDFIYEYSFKSGLVNESRGYVKVINENGEYRYFVSFSSDNLGIEETEKENLDVDLVKSDVVINKPYGNMCTID